MNTPDNNDELDDDFISKSELKRQMHALQALGESLITLPKKQLQQLSIGDELRDALAQAKEMKNDNGRRRQIQRIGKLMRHEDADAIQGQLASFVKSEKGEKKKAEQEQEQINSLLAMLIDQDDGLTRFIEQFPNTDRQLIRQLISAVKKEKNQTQSTVSKKSKRLMDEIKVILNDKSEE